MEGPSERNSNSSIEVCNIAQVKNRKMTDYNILPAVYSESVDKKKSSRKTPP